MDAKRNKWVRVICVHSLDRLTGDNTSTLKWLRLEFRNHNITREKYTLEMMVGTALQKQGASTTRERWGDMLTCYQLLQSKAVASIHC